MWVYGIIIGVVLIFYVGSKIKEKMEDYRREHTFYEITFQTNCELKVEKMSAKEGTQIILPKLEHEGYTFGGWFLHDNLTQGGPHFNSLYAYDHYVFYAKWTEVFVEKEKGYYLKLSGVTYNNRQQNIQKLHVGEEVIYVREPHNAYDKYAILVKTKSGLELGYIPKENNQSLANQIDRGGVYKTVVSQITGTASQYKGVNLFISETKKPEDLLRPEKPKSSPSRYTSYDDGFDIDVLMDIYSEPSNDDYDDGDSSFDPSDDFNDYDGGNW